MAKKGTPEKRRGPKAPTGKIKKNLIEVFVKHKKPGKKK